MLLTIDGGNTNTVFAVFDDAGKLVGQWRAASKSGKTADEHGVWLRQLLKLDGIRLKSIDEVIIATVVPADLFNLRSLSETYFKCTPLVVGDPGVDLGLGVKVDSPSEVGADRLVNAVAAFETYGGPLTVIDFGTATTFDVISETGDYIGGVISPGINLSLEALYLAAAKLPRVAVQRPPKVVGTNTVDAMRSGVYWGYVGLIEGTIRRIRDELGAKAGVIATGGLAPLFKDVCPDIDAIDGDLTVRGLCAINKLNRKR